MKKTPAAKPNCAAVSPRSLVRPFGPANEIAVRSRKLMKNISATNGTSRIDTLRMAERSTADGGVGATGLLLENGMCRAVRGLRAASIRSHRISWYDE